MWGLVSVVRGAHTPRHSFCLISCRVVRQRIQLIQVESMLGLNRFFSSFGECSALGRTLDRYL